MLNYSFNISEEEIEYYKYYGYLILEEIIDSALIDQAREETIKIDRQNKLDIWKRRKSDAVLRLANHPGIMDILHKIYEHVPFPFQTLNFLHSPAIRVHSDTIHFNTAPLGYMCGVWVALEDSTVNNGPLVYYPNSHHLYPTMFEDIDLKPTRELHLQNLGQYSLYLENKIDKLKLKSKTLTCKKGTLLIWDANLMHRSEQPRPNTTRCSQVTHYYFDVPTIQYLQPAYGRHYKKIDAKALQQHIAASEDAEPDFDPEDA